MEPGDVLRRSWEVYRAHWRHLVTIAAVVLVPLGAVTAPLALLGWPGIVGANVLDLSALFLVNGALVRAVDDVRLGRPDMSVAETFRQTGPRLVVLAVAGVLAAVAIFVGLLLLVVPGLVLLTWWFVLSPVVVLEGQGVLPAFGRSRALVRGHGWPVFGVAIVTLLVELVVSLTLGAAVLPLGSAVSSFVQTAVGNTLVSPFVAVAATLAYFELRGHPTGPGGHLEPGH
jgi:hypothetical protein